MNFIQSAILDIQCKKWMKEYEVNLGTERVSRKADTNNESKNDWDYLNQTRNKFGKRSENTNGIADEIKTSESNSEPMAASDSKVSVHGSENEIPNNPKYTEEATKKEESVSETANTVVTKQPEETTNKEESVSETANIVVIEQSAESTSEPIIESVEASSAAIPRVEDNHISGDRPVDFSGLFERNQKSKGRVPDLIKASRTLPQAEKDLPPEERSIQSCVINYMTDGAMNPQRMNPNPYINDASSGIAVPQQQQQTAAIPVDYGSFKVDNPQPQKPKAEKAQPDNVEGVEQIADMVESATESLGVEDTNKRSKYTIFQTTPTSTPRISPDEINHSMQSNNQEMIKKYWWLEGVEKAANINGCTVSFVEGLDQNGNPNGIMFVYAYTKNGDVHAFNQYKSFIIDYGKLFYDGRIKAFLTIDPSEIECRMLNGFEIIDNGEKNVKKWKEDFLNTIFKAGIMAIDPKSGMFTEKYRQLNIFVNMASTPTGKMNGKDKDRINARNRLLNSIDAGVFVHAKSYDPNCRFVYYDFDTRSKVFMIVNNATQTPLAILYTPENATVLYGDIQDSINKFEEAKNKFRSNKNK